MADSKNIPQEAEQLSEALDSKDEETSKQAKSEVASTDFDKEYEIAQQNETGSGNQSSDSNPVSRKKAGGSDGDTSAKKRVDDIDSPGDSDPDDYLDMAKDVKKTADSDQ
ncbi:MAG: hypothetical protein WA885_16495 [Phormidesmis sp.]